MNHLSLEEIKQISFDILLDLDRIFKKNGIRYYLACGTLLGAIRHKDFIPWDDDIDVWFHVEDYDRIVSCLSDESRYTLLDGYTDVSFPGGWLKLYDQSTVLIDRDPRGQSFRRGVNVDLFPLTCFCDGPFSKNHKRFLFYYKRLLPIFSDTLLMGQQGFKRRMITALLIVTGMSLRSIKKELLDMQILEKHGDLISGWTDPYHVPFKKESFDEIAMMEFHHKLFPCPKGYNDVLTMLYSDNWIELPPVNQRFSNHTVQYYSLSGRTFK